MFFASIKSTNHFQIPEQRKPEIKRFPPSPDSTDTKSGQRQTNTNKPKASTAKPHIQEDQDSNHSWVEMIDHDESAQPSKQVQKPVPMIMLPQPENRSPNPRATAATSIPAKDMDNQPIVQLTMAQFQALVNSSPQTQVQPQPQTQQSSPDFFSQTQTQLDNTFFDQEAPVIAKKAAAAKRCQASLSIKWPIPSATISPINSPQNHVGTTLHSTRARQDLRHQHDMVMHGSLQHTNLGEVSSLSSLTVRPSTKRCA